MRVLDDGIGGDRFRPPREPDRARRGRQSRPEDRARASTPTRARSARRPDGDRRPDRGGAAPPGDRARVRHARARAGRDRARRGRALRPLAVREDGRARAHRGAVPRVGRRGGVLVPRLDARDGGARRGRHGQRGLAVGPHPVAVPGRDLGHARAARALAAGDARRRGARRVRPDRAACRQRRRGDPDPGRAGRTGRRADGATA